MDTSSQRRLSRSIGPLAVFLAAIGLSACNQFLTGSKLRNDPSKPTSASPSNLFTSVQLNVTARQTDYIAQSVCIWMQECAGQNPPYSSVGTYSFGDNDYYDAWADYFGGGGLLDVKTIEKTTLQRGDSLFTGETYVLEALLMSEAADIWGDIPYSQAADRSQFPHPKLDAQQFVYDSILTKLATATVLLAATGPTNAGTVGADLVYADNASQWTALANTLRARIFLHMAKKLGPAMYDSALAAAAVGITDATGAGDYLSVNQGTAFQGNLWSQVNIVYAGNVVAGKFFVDLLNGASDSRLPVYYLPADTLGNFVGADPGQIGGTFSQFNPTRVAQAFRQPIVTFAENALIRAEASFQRGNPGAALTFLNSERAAVGQAPIAGPATLQNIMLEKYSQMYQNIEIWSDWRRTNIPALIAYKSGSIPRRIAYQLAERAANPSIPDAGPSRNWNDP
jgi:Starch-binding associating with outer membrane